jgi:hypothetical protein
VLLVSFIHVSYFIIKSQFITINYYFNHHYTNVNGFVTGKLDAVTCFHCGVTLKDWNETDCCSENHAKWSPNYIYIQHVKKFPVSVLHSTPRTQ